MSWGEELEGNGLSPFQSPTRAGRGRRPAGTGFSGLGDPALGMLSP